MYPSGPSGDTVQESLLICRLAIAVTWGGGAATPVSEGPTTETFGREGLHSSAG